MKEGEGEGTEVEENPSSVGFHQYICVPLRFLQKLVVKKDVLRSCVGNSGPLFPTPLGESA